MLPPVPDSAIVKALKRVDPGLTVEWVEPPCRWAICHDVQAPGNFDHEVEALTRELQIQLSRSGYLVPLEDIQWEAAQAVRARRVVFYVTEDNGDFRELDQRAVEKVQRMDYYRRNLDIGDWKQLLNAKADEARRRMQADRDDIWSVIQRDKVFASQVSDILWGNRPVRSVRVPTGIERVLQ